MTRSERNHEASEQDEVRRILAKRPKELIQYEREMSYRLYITTMLTGVFEAIRLLCYTPVAWLAYLAVDSMAGKETLISGNMASIVSAFIGGAGTASYLTHQIKARQDKERIGTIERQRKYIEELEHKALS